MSRNAVLTRCVTGVLRDVSLLRQEYSVTETERDRAVALQRGMLEAIRSGDHDAVRDAVDAHMLQLEVPLIGRSLRRESAWGLAPAPAKGRPKRSAAKRS